MNKIYIITVVFVLNLFNCKCNPVDEKHVNNESVNGDKLGAPPDPSDVLRRQPGDIATARITNTNIIPGLVYLLREETRPHGAIACDGYNASEQASGLYLWSSISSSYRGNYFVVEQNGTYVAIRNALTNEYICHNSTYFILSTNFVRYDPRLNISIDADNKIKIYNPPSGRYLSYLNAYYSYAQMYRNDGYLASSSWVANWTFIPAYYDLWASVGSIEYSYPLNNSLANKTVYYSLLTKSIINNPSPASVTHEFAYSESAKDSYRYEFNQNVDIFDSLDIDRSAPLAIRDGSEVIGIDMRTAVRNAKPMRRGNTRNSTQEYTNERKLTIKKTVEVPACSSLKIDAHLEQLYNFPIYFTAKLEIFGSQNGTDFTSDVLLQLLDDINYKYTVVTMNEFSVVVETNGILFVTYGIDISFNVTPF